MRDTAAADLPLPTGAEAAVALAELLREGDVVWAAATEAEARRIVAAVAVAAPAARVVLMPETDALPGAGIGASAANIGQRRAALMALATGDGRPTALVTTVGALAHVWPAPGAALDAGLVLRSGDAADLAELTQRLVGLGYIEDDRVDEPGEVALQGQVVDLFPAQDTAPVRIEAADGRITFISRYDAVNQRTTGDLDEVRALPALEPATDGGSLLAHLPAARVVLDPSAAERRRGLAELADSLGDGAAAAQRALLDDAAWIAALDGHPVLCPQPAQPAPDRFVESRAPERAFRRAAEAAWAAGERVVLLGAPRDLRFLSRRAARLLGREAAAAASWDEVTAAPPGALMCLPMPCERGFRRSGVLAVAAADLLGSRARRGDEGAAALSALPDMTAIRIGDVVVHEDHGVGVVLGLETIPAVEGTPAADAVRLGYAGDATRLVPMDQARRMWRYGAEPEAVTLDRLDGDSWKKRRAGVSEAVDETAAALIALAEARQAATAPVLEADAALYERFAAGFPFPATADQHRAFEAVADDLRSGRPMDRLVIGDVGFGKTEIALRAAAIAVLAGKQVALAVPTTVLARQHADSFARRFAPLGIEVASLARLSSATERKRVRDGLADGSVRVVVGTAAVAGKGVAYADLGLVIIDEEQRFGAADKNRLRGLGAAHVLSMTATPIPRTLQAAMIGLQQMSVLSTPPARRQPIRTCLDAFSPALLRGALRREQAHGGQSFVVVPRIADMEPLAAELARVVPDLTIVQAHGKMPAADLDDAMIRFAGGDGDVLLATNIIEAGLDVPRANTMIVCNADSFGLAQLHQLRGRVGRAARRGHMLMLTEAGKELPAATARRLQTLEMLDRLGAGFEISARDLDLRGGGDLAGDDQTGHARLIGVDLYRHMLAAALRTAQGGAAGGVLPDLLLGVEARLPDSWIADPDTRLQTYMRLARIDSAEAVDLIEAELDDRFGAPPPEAGALLAQTRLRALAARVGLARVVAGPRGIVLHPAPGAAVVPDNCRLGDVLESRDDVLVCPEAIEDPMQRMTRAADLLERLAAVRAEPSGAPLPDPAPTEAG